MFKRKIDRIITQTEGFYLKLLHCGYDPRSPQESYNTPLFYHALICITEGHGRYEVNGKTFPLHKGDVALIPQGAAYATISDEGTPFSLYYIGFHGPSTESLLSHAGFHSNALVQSGGDQILKKFVSIFKLFTVNSFNSVMKANILFFEILCFFFEKNKKNDEVNPEKYYYVKMAEDYIQEYYMNDITTADISRSLHLNRTYLSNLFATIKGITLKQYLNSYRISIAIELLTQTDYSITKIAMLAGFKDHVNFYRQFKKITSFSPKQFQMEYRNDPNLQSQIDVELLHQKNLKKDK